ALRKAFAVSLWVSRAMGSCAHLRAHAGRTARLRRKQRYRSNFPATGDDLIDGLLADPVGLALLVLTFADLIENGGHTQSLAVELQDCELLGGLLPALVQLLGAFAVFAMRRVHNVKGGPSRDLPASQSYGPVTPRFPACRRSPWTLAVEC